MNEDKHTIKSGYLKVSGGHKIWYMDWGNPEALPIFYLHGGPGGGCRDKNKLFFDPKKHRVIFHDQRGTGKSLPFGSLKDNTTPNLVKDINALRKYLGLKDIQIFGGSWGSTLALAYATANPKNVAKMLLWGIFTGLKSEVDYIQQGGAATHFPEAWQQYIEIVPEEYLNNTVEYYYKQMQHKDTSIANEHARRFSLNESALMSIDNDWLQTELDSFADDEAARLMALIEAHYFVNDCFLDTPLLQEAAKLTHIPTVIVQGRFDHVCPPETAYKLAQIMGDNCHLQFVPSNHGKEGAMREVARAYSWAFLG